MRILSLVVIIPLMLSVCACNASDAVLTEIPLADGISLLFEETQFEKNTDKPTDCGNGYICLVNNQPLWGADGKMPTTKLKKAQVVIKGVKADLDTSGMYDPVVSINRKSHYSVVHYFDDTWKVRGRFSDGAGAYYAEWLVTKAGSIRVMIGDTELLYDAFDSFFSEAKD